MLSAEEARKRSESSQKARLKREKKKLKKKRKKAIAKGEFGFETKSLSYEARRELKEAGYIITRIDDRQREHVSWEQLTPQK